MFHPLHRLTIDPNAELPSVLSVGDDLLVHDGRPGSPCQLLQVGTAAGAAGAAPRFRAEVKATHDLTEITGEAPLTLQKANRAADGSTRLLAQVRHEAAKAVHFELVSILLPAEGPAELLWKVSGAESLYDAILADDSSWWLFSEQIYEAGATPTKPSTSIQPAPGIAGGTATKPTHPPYSWAQTSDTVTIAFSLPPSLRKQDIRVHFSPPDALRLALSDQADLGVPKIVEVDGEADALSPEVTLATSLQAGSYERRRFWGPIDVDGSVWTWEQAIAPGPTKRTIGLLTLHLEKKHEGTRWPHIFQGDAEAGEEAVHETMDPSELLSALEGIEKYTSMTADDGTGLDRTGLSGDRPSLLRDGLEEEDASVGRPLRITKVTSQVDASPVPYSALCLPLPSAVPTLSIKNGLDGCLWTFNSGEPQHVETIPALSYVLASKREAHRCYSVLSRDRGIALAFEGPTPELGESSGGSTGTLFIYYGPERASSGKQGMHGQSRVVKLGSGESGLLIDVAATGADDAPLLCLTRSQLLVLRNWQR